MVSFQEAIFPGIDLENRVVHRIGIVACFISQMGMGRYFGEENQLSNLNVPKKQPSEKGINDVRFILRLSRMQPMPFKNRISRCGQDYSISIPTPPTLVSPTSFHAMKFASCRGSCIVLGKGSKIFKPILTRSRTGKPQEDIHKPVPCSECIYSKTHPNQ